MAKKITIAALILACFAYTVSAQDAPKKVEPKIGFESETRLDTMLVGNEAKSNDLDSGNGVNYIRSALKATAAYDLGGGYTLTPWASFRWEPSKTRTRSYFGLDNKFALDKSTSLQANLEARLNADTGDNIQLRLSPRIRFDQKIDALSWGIDQYFHYYNDRTSGENEDGKDDSQFELEGTYSLGYSIKLDDSTTLKFDTSDVLTLTLPSYYQANTANPKQDTIAIANTFLLTAGLQNGGAYPYLGFKYVWNTDSNLNPVGVKANIPAGVLGFNFSKDTWSIATVYEVGPALHTGSQNGKLVSRLGGTLKVKF